MKPSRTFEQKGEEQCGCCGANLEGKESRRVEGVLLCEGCNFTLHDRGFLHLDETNGSHTFWVLQDHIKKVVLTPNQYVKFCSDHNYLTTA